jgi:hypothetical protein
LEVGYVVAIIKVEEDKGGGGEATCAEDSGRCKEPKKNKKARGEAHLSCWKPASVNESSLPGICDEKLDLAGDNGDSFDFLEPLSSVFGWDFIIKTRVYFFARSLSCPVRGKDIVIGGLGGRCERCNAPITCYTTENKRLHPLIAFRPGYREPVL